MQIASLSWAFEVEVIEGEVVDPWAMDVAGFMTMPSEVKFKLKLRGDWVVDGIRRECKSAEKGLGKVMGAANDVEK
ncbi:hypothetical protein N7454_000806 [Penicillium verhagenii]|nr:hypothetical protein N7454_000806 [Penicillium verhagenii]